MMSTPVNGRWLRDARRARALLFAERRFAWPMVPSIALSGMNLILCPSRSFVLVV